HPPGAVAVAPGRMNIIGEHTDYNEGYALPAAIDRHVAVALRLRRDSHLAMRSDRFQATVNLDGLPSRRQGNWTDYLAGVAREIDQEHGPGPGLDVYVASALPVGSGLSPSGALEVASPLPSLAARGIELPVLAIPR